MKLVTRIAAAVLIAVQVSALSFAADDTENAKDAELKMLRAAVKKNAEEMDPMRAKLKAQAVQIQ